MENPRTPETLNTQNPGDEIIGDVSAFSGLGDLSAGLAVEIPIADNGGTVSVFSENSEIFSMELSNEAAEKETGVDGLEREILDVGAGATADAVDGVVNHGGVENCLVSAGKEDSTIELDTVTTAEKQIEVSGDGISLAVDFSSLRPDEAELTKSIGMEEIAKEAEDSKQVIENGQNYSFSVGEVIWIKTKSATWWPGKICNPSDLTESDETNQSASLLVVYYGSSHVAWCSPSQLAPFAENFEQMYLTYKSRSFLAAVEKAVDEFGRWVKLEMTCPCFQGKSWPLKSDAGSRETICLSECKFGSLSKFSVGRFEPETFLARIKDLAEVASLIGVLELSILYNQLASFQRSIGHQQLSLDQLYGTFDAENNAVGKAVRKRKVHTSVGDNEGPAEGGLQCSQLDPLSIECNMGEKDGDLNKQLDGSKVVGQKNSGRKEAVSGGTKSRPRKGKGNNEFEDLESSKSDSLIKEEIVSSIGNERNVSGAVNLNTESKGIYGKSSETRERKKSKYLSFPYINWGQKGMPAETEDVETPKTPGEGVNANAVEDPNEISTPSKCGGKFWRKWYKNITNGNDVSGNEELMNVSPVEFLSELHFTAVNCLYPNENKNFDSVARFFSRFRISMFHDESVNSGQNDATAADLFFLGGKVSEIKRPSSAAKSSGLKKRSLSNCSITKMGEIKLRKNSDEVFPAGEPLDISQPTSNMKPKKGIETSGRLKTKSLSGLSDVTSNVSTNLLEKDSMEKPHSPPNGLPKRKKKKSDGSSFEHPPIIQTTELPDLNGSGSISGALVEDQQATGHIAPKKKSESKKRKKLGAAKEHPNVTTSLLGVNDRNKSDSFFIDLQVSAPQSVGIIPEENKVDSIGASVTPKQLVKDQQTTGQVQKSESKKRKKKEKPPLVDPKIGLESDILPDLNGVGVESSQGKEFQLTNGLPPQAKPKRKRRRKCEIISEQLSKTSDSRPHIYNRVETDGEGLGSLLLLTFSEGVSMPSEEQFVTTFSQFESLKVSEIQLKDSTAEIVFLKSADAKAAIRSLKKNNVFGPTLLKYQLYHLSAPPKTSESDRSCTALAYPASEGHFNPSKTGESGPQAGEVPPLEFIRKNLQMMTSMLEKSGDNLSSEMRAKLESDIEGLLKKVSSMAGSSST